jgi:hypothetical protein
VSSTSSHFTVVRLSHVRLLCSVACQVPRNQGNFHFAPGKSFQHAHMHIHDLAAFPAGKFNVSHRIKQISFGEPFPGVVNPLDDTEKMFGLADSGGMAMSVHTTSAQLTVVRSIVCLPLTVVRPPRLCADVLRSSS